MTRHWPRRTTTARRTTPKRTFDAIGASALRLWRSCPASSPRRTLSSHDESDVSAAAIGSVRLACDDVIQPDVGLLASAPEPEHQLVQHQAMLAEQVSDHSLVVGDGRSRLGRILDPDAAAQGMRELVRA